MTQHLIEEIHATQQVLRGEPTHQAAIVSQRLRELVIGIEALSIENGEEDDRKSRDRVDPILKRAEKEARFLRGTQSDVWKRLTDLRSDLGDWITTPVTSPRHESDDRFKPNVEGLPEHVLDDAENGVAQFRDYAEVVAEMKSPDFENWVGAEQATIALVFTDINGSTKQQVDMGEEAFDVARKAHFNMADHLTKKHKAFLIKKTGDGFMIAFRTAPDALRFAVKFLGDTGHPDISIRAGIHVGKIRVDNGDAYGTMVHETARIADIPKGATIWLSNEAKEQIDAEKAADLESLKFREHRGRRLKDIGTKDLWSVRLPTLKLQGK